MKKRNFKNYSELDYYNFARGTYFGVKGWFYWLSKPMELRQIRDMFKFTNIAFLKGRAQYAPERINDVIFVGDKSFDDSTRFVTAFKRAYGPSNQAIYSAKPYVQKHAKGVEVSCTINGREYYHFFVVS